jgi:tRNA(adenine34) deaminase
MTQEEKDHHYMKMAIKEALYAFDMDEVPVGCVIVAEDRVIARGHNLVERLHDFTAHAEMQAFTAASEFLNGKSLTQCTLYVTLEPCVMCAGAAYNTRIGRLVFGAFDQKRGFTLFNNEERQLLHPKTEWVGGIMADDCADILTQFFQTKRK